MSLDIEVLRGAEIELELPALAETRIAVFRDWPYLYEGHLDYELQYLRMYLDCPDSLAILVWDGDDCIGASTVLPLAAAPADLQQPFVDAGMAVESVDYFGESVLLKPYRGRGLGVKFFELRENHARALGLASCAFCAVDRNPADPRKPADYVPNDAFWTHRGYVQAPQLKAQLSWPDIGDATPSAKTMTFWQRTL